MMTRTRRLSLCRIAPLLVAFVAAGNANAVQSGGDAREVVVGSSSLASIARVEDTLQSLLKSLQELGQNSVQLFGQKQRWCHNASRLFGREQVAQQSADVSRIQTEFREQQAALEEVKGTEQQLRSETMLVQHTINVTSAILRDSHLSTSLVQNGELDPQRAQNDAKLLSELVDSRQQILVSLQGELDNLLPVRSHLQVRVAELHRQMNDKNGSANAMSLFSESIRDACSGSMRSADAQAQARSSQALHISRALQALETIEAQRRHAEIPAASFLQIKQDGEPATEDDLFDVFGNDHDSSDSRQQDPPQSESQLTSNSDDQESFTLEPVEADVDHQDAESEPTAISDFASREAPALSPAEVPVPAVTLLASLRAAKGAAGEKQQQWCTKERSHSELLLELARDSLDQVGSEVAAHTDSEAQLTDTRGIVRQIAIMTDAAAAEIVTDAQREVAFISGHAKDQILATKILKQAVAVLSGVEDVGGSSSTKARAAAISDLSAAQNDFQAQSTASGEAAKATKLQAKKVAARASEAARAFRREEESLGLACDAHMTERLRLADSQRAKEAETKEAAAFLQTLAAGCAKDAAGAAEKQRQAEVRALEDAQRVMEGKVIGHAQNNNLRGVQSKHSKKALADMTPIERAALTMGVDVDES